MKRGVRWGLAVILAALLVYFGGWGRTTTPQVQAASNPPAASNGGELKMLGAQGQLLGICPLKHTDVSADISGYVGRIHVRQTFHNPSATKIEAVYVFPLPNDSAVDDMTMTVGARTIVGVVKPKEEARAAYEQAKQQGHVASLLDQQRPNIFTQNVANIEPGAEITVDISYVETLKYQDGTFEWVFPMVVGPRYNGGSPLGSGSVPDADKISPPITPQGTRAGHDISLRVHIDAGMPLYNVTSVLHAIDVQPDGPTGADIALRNQAEIPNRDFILRYRTATGQVNEAFLTHTDPRGTFFTLVLQPPRRVAPAQAVPKEMVFVIDQTGSQEGWPLQKAKETMRHCIQNLNPGDTFQLLGFNTDVYPCFKQPVPATNATVSKALTYLNGIQADGGTDILKAAAYALNMPTDPNRLRIVCYMTDGYVGNDFEILDYIQKHRGQARMFPFGIGNGVNRFLIDNMAREGGGEPEYVTLNEDGAQAAAKFYDRVHNPVLTNIKIDWGTLPVSDIYPKIVPDLFDAKPIMVQGRLTGPAQGTIILHGITAEGNFERRMDIQPTDTADRHDALPSLWARAAVDDLMHQDLQGVQNGTINPDLKKQITDLGVQYHLMTQFTSFVAIDQSAVTKPGPAQTVDVPVEMPDGVSYAAGGNQMMSVGAAAPAPMRAAYKVSTSHAFAGRAGDPLLTVEAPADALQVIALMPGGDIKKLVYNPTSKAWEARFDIPTYTAEGDYAVTVIVVHKDATRSRLTLHYQVDLTAPTGHGQARTVGGQTLRLTLTTGDSTSRVTALLPWGTKTDLSRSDTSPDQFGAVVPLPPGYANAKTAVTYVLTDKAHNRTTITVDMAK